jgi:hypothetical protein
LWVKGELVPVTVKFVVPAACVLDEKSVSVDTARPVVGEGVTELGLKLPVIPLGNPVTVIATGEL